MKEIHAEEREKNTTMGQLLLREEKMATQKTASLC